MIRIIVTIGLPAALCLTLTGCIQGRTDPCLAQWKCANCTMLFEKIQQNLHDPATAARLQECYDQACK